MLGRGNNLPWQGQERLGTLLDVLFCQEPLDFLKSVNQSIVPVEHPLPRHKASFNCIPGQVGHMTHHILTA
jgi:hypothetical protein